jgi:hypothetical protein
MQCESLTQSKRKVPDTNFFGRIKAAMIAYTPIKKKVLYYESKIMERIFRKNFFVSRSEACTINFTSLFIAILMTCTSIN